MLRTLSFLVLYSFFDVKKGFEKLTLFLVEVITLLGNVDFSERFVKVVDDTYVIVFRNICSLVNFAYLHFLPR